MNATRIVTAVLVLTTSSLLILASATDLIQTIKATDAIGLAKVIEGNSVYRMQLTDSQKPFDEGSWVGRALIERVIGSESFRSASLSCLNDGSRASVSDAAGAFDQYVLTEDRDNAVRQALAGAERSVKQRLKCSPVDGNAWSLLAHLHLLIGGTTQIDHDILDLSYFFAPAEKWIMLPRIRFVDRLIELRLIAPPPGHSADLQSFVDLSSIGEIASLYADSGTATRSIMRNFIDGQRLNRRQQIMRQIDALGVDYPIPERCRQHLPKDAPPGSELQVRRPADLIEACEK